MGRLGGYVVGVGILCSTESVRDIVKNHHVLKRLILKRRNFGVLLGDLFEE